MDTSIFLARVIGLYMLIAGFAVLVKGKRYREIVEQFVDDKALMLIVAIITLILGLLLVISHNLWVADWRVAITILAWVTMASAILRLFFPEAVVAMAQKFKMGVFFRVLAVVIMAVGAYLTYQGFA